MNSEISNQPKNTKFSKKIPLELLELSCLDEVVGSRMHDGEQTIEVPDDEYILDVFEPN